MAKILELKEGSDPLELPRGEVREISATGLRINMSGVFDAVHFRKLVLYLTDFGRTKAVIIPHDPTNPLYVTYMASLGVTFDQEGNPQK